MLTLLTLHTLSRLTGIRTRSQVKSMLTFYNFSDDRKQYQAVKTLPLKAVTNAHFYLDSEAIAFESAQFLQWRQMRFQVRCDGHKFKRWG